MRLSSPATRCLPAFSPQQQICQRKQEPEQSCQVGLWLVAVPANSGNTNRETSAKHSRRVILQDSSASMCLLPDCLRRSKNSRCVLLLARSDFRSTSHLKQSALQLDGGANGEQLLHQVSVILFAPHLSTITALTAAHRPHRVQGRKLTN